jgi:hypothetical protein
MLYIRVENNEIIGNITKVPIKFNNISNFDKLSDSEKIIKGWYPVIEINNDYNSSIQTRTGPVFTIEADRVDATYTIVDKSVSDCRLEAINRLKIEAANLLVGTDYLSIRATELGEDPVPPSVLTYRSDVREASNLAEEDINIITNKQAIIDYIVAWPDLL